jgi:2-polyprenyl-6-methoxyphenol hydroxylase-like FAD-dependent oxidoreductase
VPSVTLLGDDAHVTAPNGERANLAIYDGAELAKAHARRFDNVEAALSSYERAMFSHSMKAASRGMAFYEILAHDNAAGSLVEIFSQGAPNP